MPNRSVSIARDGQNLHFHYAKRNPATGAYYTSADISAVTFSVVAKDGTVLLAPTAAAFVAATKGYVLDWDPGSALDARNVLYVIALPTTTQPRALVPDEVTQIDVADVLQRIDELATSLAELNADVGEDTDPTSGETVQARLRRIAENQENEAVTYERLSG